MHHSEFLCNVELQISEEKERCKSMLANIKKKYSKWIPEGGRRNQQHEHHMRPGGGLQMLMTHPNTCPLTNHRI